MKQLYPVLALLLASAASAFGQAASTGAISGTITDAQGAVVPGATVTVTNQATGVAKTETTNDSGFYSAESLIAGTYTITIDKTGFQTAVVKDFALAPGQRLQNSVSLQTGNVKTEVTVEANAVQVQTESGQSAGVINAEQVSNLMLNGRNFQQLGMLVPGVSNMAGASAQNGGGLTGSTSLIVNGQGIDTSTYTIDGTYNMNTGNMTNINILPPIDIIAQFEVAKNAYSAKYGMAGGGQIMVDTKSGSSDYHGTLWEFLRNNAFDARNFFQSTPPTLRQNIFGFELGGPLSIPKIYDGRKHRTFFLASEEWRVIHNGLVDRGSFITPAMIGGDFSNSFTLPTGGLTLDATGQAVLASEGKTNCLLSRTQLNPACLDSNSVILAKAFFPSSGLVPNQFVNYTNPINVEKLNQRDDTYRVDQYIGQRFVAMARVMYENVTDDLPDMSGWGASGGSGNVDPITKANIGTTGLNALVRLTATIKPTVVNTTSLVQTFDKPRLLGPGDTMPSGVSIPQAFSGAELFDRPPQIAITGGYAGIGSATLPVYASDGEGTVSDDLSVIKGNHVIQTGGLYIFGIKRQNAFSSTNGVFTFNGVHTGDPAADFLLGLDSSYSQQNVERRYYDHYRQFEPYIQDDWKVNRKLTLNLGIRYYYFSSDTVQIPVSNFKASAYNAAQAPQVLPNGNYVLGANGQPVTASGATADLLTGMVTAGQNGIPPGFFISRKTLLAPRFGFAWDASNNGTTVIRGGFGVGYSRTPFNIANGNGNALTNPPYQETTTIFNSALSAPLSGSVSAATPPSIYLVPDNFQPDEIESWNFTVEHQLFHGAVWNIAYVGSAARHLPVNQDINFPLPVTTPFSTSCLSPGEGIPAGGFNFDPCLNASVVATRTYSGFVPYSGYNAISGLITDGNSNYHSLQTGLTYRVGGSTASAAYTWGKTLTDANNSSGASTAGGSTPQNPRDLTADYGPAGFNRTHVFTGSWVYALPFLKNSGSVLGELFGNWSFTGIAVLESGFPLTVSVTGATGPSGYPRADIVGSITYPRTVAEWFDTASFAAPLNGFFGNSGVGILQGPSEKSFNIALFKNFPVKERAHFEFRAEAFNIANHTNFNSTGISTTIGSGNFGQVTSALDPRILEFAVKLVF